MRTALIGHTGFVGSNLKQQHCFTDLYNSQNFQEMKNQEYDLVVCAGVSAVKWLANKDPESDRSSIEALQNILKTIVTDQFILISTIDVYPVTKEKNESFDCYGVDNHAYGAHRLAFEQFCANKFNRCSVVRLPGLFGEGLKKNVIFDLLNDNCLDMINIRSSFQYYYLKNLWKDIQIVIGHNLKLVNFFTEPVSTQQILNQFFTDKEVGQSAVAEGHYDLYTEYAHLWNKDGSYLYSKGEIFQQLSEFIEGYKNRQRNQ